MILAYVVLFVHWPQIAAWLAAATAALTAIWAFWELLVKFFTSFSTARKKWQEDRASVRRAKERADRAAKQHHEASISLMAVEREQAVQHALRGIEKMEFEERQKPGQSTWRVTTANPKPGEDPEIVAEAWRRFKVKRDERDNQNWKKR